jgi:hypothetical protein
MDAITVPDNFLQRTADPTVLQHDWLRIQRTGENSCNIHLKVETLPLGRDGLGLLARLINLAALYYDDSLD